MRKKVLKKRALMRRKQKYNRLMTFTSIMALVAIVCGAVALYQGGYKVSNVTRGIYWIAVILMIIGAIVTAATAH